MVRKSRAAVFCVLSSLPLELASLLLIIPTIAIAQEKITYDDHISPIFRNNCFKCHNPDKTKADLDLTTYNGVLKGGSSGKAVLPGDASGSKLYKSIARIEEPFMPDKGPKLAEADIELVKKWIAGGLLEKSSSQALAANKPKLNPSSNATAGKKPDGPLVLPVEWRLEPVARTERTTAVTALAASPWSPLVAVGGQHQLLVYHAETLELLGVLSLPEVNPSCVQFSRDSRLLVVGAGRGAKFGFVDVYDVATGERVVRVGNEFDSVLAADLNSDQTGVALGGPAKHVKIFSTRDSHMTHDLKKHTDWVTAIQYSPDSVLLATGDRNGGLVVWEADSGQELYTLTGHTAAISSLSWRDDSDVLLSASEDGSIRVWEMKEGRQVATWSAHKDGVLDARFTHDTRIASCGRDKQIVLWDASGNKQKSWDGGDLPVRVTFSHDGSNVLASSWEGKVTVWQATDGKSRGEMTPNPPTLAERLALAMKEVEGRTSAAAKSEQAATVTAEEAAKVRAAVAAYDQSSPSFQFVAATRQAQTAHRKAAEESGKGLEKLKAVAAKSAAVLAAAEAESAKVQTALDKVDKFSEPYKQLARQLEGSTQKVAAATAKVSENAKALADKTAAANAAAADLSARAALAVQARDKASSSLEELGKQVDTVNQTVAQARATAEADKLKLTQQEAAVSQAMAVVTSSENEASTITQTLATASTNSPQGKELAKQLEAAVTQLADARATQQIRQKGLEDVKTQADKSVALVVAREAELSKLKTSIETAQKTLQTATGTVTQLEAARVTAAEAAKKETEALQAVAAKATAELAAAKAETADLQAKLEKTEKFSDAYKELARQLEAANKQVSVVRVPADHDRKEMADLQAAVDKIAASVAAADAEAAKAIATMAKSDPIYQRFQELEKQLEAANQKAGEARAVAAKARQDFVTARRMVAQIRAAQAQFALSQARESLAARQQQHEQQGAAAATAEAEIRTSQAELENVGKAVDVARDTVRKAGNASRASQARLVELGRQIRLLNESLSKNVVRLRTAKAAATRLSPQLAAEKDRVDKLTAEYMRLKTAPDNTLADARQ